MANATVTVHSPMTGRVIEALVGAGDRVSAGDVVAVIESMKMENEVVCDADGVVSAVHFAEDDSVSEGDALVEVETG